ncbi:MAG: LysR family transcriptional regulator [Clostridium sp.]|nr:LysR family transcriptional regulator [Clostridium sp.]
MNMNQYRYVIAVAENASISKAARELFITQPALTKYLNKLEEDLGAVLFDRSVTPLQITYAGKIYIETGRQILELQKRLEQQLGEISNLQRGSLSIGINSERGSWCLPLLVPEFKRRYPGIELQISEGHSQFLEDELLKNHIDLAIGTLPLLSPELDFKFLSDEPIILAVPMNHPLAQKYDLSRNTPLTPYYLKPERLNGQNMITLGREQGMGRIAYQFFERHGIRPNIVMTFRNNATALRMASAGMGMIFAIADSVSRANLIRPMAWFTIEEPVFCRKTVAYYRQSLGLSPIAKRFIDLWDEMLVAPSSTGKPRCRAVMNPPEL